MLSVVTGLPNITQPVGVNHKDLPQVTIFSPPLFKVVNPTFSSITCNLRGSYLYSLGSSIIKYGGSMWSILI